MKNANEILRQINAGQDRLHKPMVSMAREFGKASGQAATEFSKAFRESTAWQNKRGEGIGGA